MTPEKPIVISVGEPAGIGPDLCLGLTDTERYGPLVMIGDPEQLEIRAATLGLTVSIELYDEGATPVAGRLTVLPIKLPDKSVCGQPNPANSKALLQGLDRAVAGCQSGEFSAVVTAPLQKSAINDAGVLFSGHTEYIAELTGAGDPVMLLIADKLRVALVTTHLPLREVADAITPERIVAVATVLNEGLKARFGISTPDIVVCGLNPHAGEGGHLGHEDQAVIAPALNALLDTGINVRGPVPADTAFTPAAGKPDAILAMYHDQGLPVLKYAGFGNAVNVTLGIPIIRTSVDHGTALDIAGTGKADPGSLDAALDIARRMAAL